MNRKRRALDIAIGILTPIGWILNLLGIFSWIIFPKSPDIYYFLPLHIFFNTYFSALGIFWILRKIKGEKADSRDS